MEKTTKKDFKKWLEYLQQESWQLELIISSILLFVLSTADETINAWMLEVTANAGSAMVSFVVIIPLALYIILMVAKTNLIIHIFLRGFWIGCIGLRYVSGDIDIDSLDYSSKFVNYLKSKGMNFDRYIENVENICSIIFSFTFLLIFSSLSFFAFIFFGGLIINLLTWTELPFVRIFTRGIAMILFASAIFSFLDYVLLGYFKRQKFISKIFYPFYRIFNFFSLSFLYRPLYYNFIDNPIGRKYLRLVIPYIMALIFLGEGLFLGAYNFMPEIGDNANYIKETYYEDKLESDETKSAVSFSIPSFEIKENMLPVYLRYHDSPRTEKMLQKVCPDFKGYDRSAIRFPFLEGFNQGWKERGREMNNLVEAHSLKADTALQCMSQLFDLKIDTLVFNNQKFHFYKHPELRSRGLLTYIDISNFERGDHTLFIEKKISYKDSAFVYKTVEIPFVKYN